MKKIILVSVVPAIIASLVFGSQVFAQTASVGGSASAGASVGSSASPIVAPEPIVPQVNPGSNAGFVEFNDLTVQSVSGTSVPAEILAYQNYSGIYPPVPTPLGSVTNGANGGVVLNTCFSFQSQNDSTGTAIPCPKPPSGAATSSTAGSAVGSSGAASSMPNIAVPVRAPYRIEVTAQTELMLRDRTVASLSDFSNGDQINVFGYYNTDGSIQAYLVRDTSKPVETQTMQLNNVTLVSMSASTSPATLAVTQTQSAPCYGFNNSAKTSIACPLGVSSFSQNSATTNVQPTPALAPMWMMLRKYVVNVDAQTIILDNNRNTLLLSSLNPNDILNVYGESSDGGQTIDADIIRDLSIPVAPTTYTGTVTQVNGDGSFVLQTNNGQTLTVQNPVTVGETVTLQGLINAAQNIISEISHITASTQTTATPPPATGM